MLTAGGGPRALMHLRGPWGWRIAMGMGSSETEGTMAEQNMLTGGFTTKGSRRNARKF